MRTVVDTNLAPACCDALRAVGHDATHWSGVGSRRAPDAEIMAWALRNHALVLSHDLGFGAILAATRAKGPGVLQVRSQRGLPTDMLPVVERARHWFADALTTGTIVVVDERRAAARTLLIRR